MKKLVLIGAAVLFSVSLGLGAAVAKDAPKDVIKIEGFGKKEPVPFDHAKHKDVKCVDCHHNEADGKYKCSECHKAEDEGKAISFKDAAHKNDVGKCWKCHRDKDASHKLKCGDCHKK